MQHSRSLANMWKEGRPCSRNTTWWRHPLETFSALLAICAGNSPVTGEFPAQRPVTRSVDDFFDLHLNKGFSKQRWGWWYYTPLCPLWRHCNGEIKITGLLSHIKTSFHRFYHRGTAVKSIIIYFLATYTGCWTYNPTVGDLSNF